MNKKTFETAIEFAKKEKGRYLIITENMPGANNEKFYGKVELNIDGEYCQVNTTIVEVTDDYVHILQAIKAPKWSHADKLHYFIPMEKIVAVEVNTSFEFNY